MNNFHAPRKRGIPPPRWGGGGKWGCTYVHEWHNAHVGDVSDQYKKLWLWLSWTGSHARSSPHHSSVPEGASEDFLYFAVVLRGWVQRLGWRVGVRGHNTYGLPP